MSNVKSKTTGQSKQARKGPTPKSVAAKPVVAALDRVVSQETAAIAGSILCPDAYPATRFQDGYDSEPTALFEPKTILEIPFSSVQGGLDSLNLTTDEQWLFAYRDPRRGLVVPQHNIGGMVSQYFLAYADGTNTTTMAANTQFYQFDTIEWQAGPKVHGDLLIGGTAPSGSPGYFPVSYGDTIAQITSGGFPASTSCGLVCNFIDGDDNNIQAMLTATSTASGTWTAVINNTNVEPDLPTNFTGYMRINHATQATTNAVFAYQYAVNGFCANHRSLGSFETVSGLVDSFRANGLSLMFTNSAAVLNKNGTVVACQIPRGTTWQSVMMLGYNALAARPLARQLAADNGVRIRWAPTNSTDMQFVDVANTVDDSELYPIQTPSDFLAICCLIPLVAGRAGKVSVHANCEGRTSSPWFAQVVDVPNGRAASAAAMDLVRQFPQIDENPFHIADVVKFLKKNRAGISKVGDVIGSALPSLLPFTKMTKAALGAL